MDKDLDDLVENLAARIAMKLEDASTACIRSPLNISQIAGIERSFNEAAALLDAIQVLLEDS
jgi:hypothetical protein